MFAFKNRAIYSNPEFQSAMVRLGIWVFAIIYMFAGAMSDHYPLHMESFATLFALYLLFFFGIMISVFMRPVWVARRYFSLLVDISATTVCIYLTGDATSPFFLLYIWIFVSYGTRYGRRQLMTASVLSIVAYSLVLTLLGQWDQNLFEAIFVLLVLGLLPYYQYSLMKKLQRARVQAEASNHLMGRFLSNMTNEMRAPLGDIITTSNELAESGLSMRQLDKMEEVISSASLLDAVIGDVLDFSKMEAGQLQTQSVPFNLQDLLLEVCSATSQCALRSKIELICSIANDVPKVIVGDEQRLRQVLVNLVRNAIGNSKDGELKVGVKVDESDPDCLLFEIEGLDQLPPEVESKIGGGELIPNDPEDMGQELRPDLGVSLARKLALIMGGDFGSVEGEDGLVFWLRLPFVVNEYEVDQVNRYSYLHGRKVFLFETNSSNRLAICKSCEAAGMTVESVDQVAALGDAISKSRERHDIDVILISDPPGGKDVARIADICLGALGQNLPLVVLAHRRNCLDMNKYPSATLIRKPVILDHLVDAMQLLMTPGRGGGSIQFPSVDVVDDSKQPSLS